MRRLFCWVLLGLRGKSDASQVEQVDFDRHYFNGKWYSRRENLRLMALKEK